MERVLQVWQGSDTAWEVFPLAALWAVENPENCLGGRQTAYNMPVLRRVLAMPGTHCSILHWRCRNQGFAGMILLISSIQGVWNSKLLECYCLVTSVRRVWFWVLLVCSPLVPSVRIWLLLPRSKPCSVCTVLFIRECSALVISSSTTLIFTLIPFGCSVRLVLCSLSILCIMCIILFFCLTTNSGSSWG